MRRQVRAVLAWVCLAIAVLAFVLALPWLAAAWSSYTDWVWCETHEPFVQHSWNVNWHHCPVASYT